jgi:hypothetical protein
MQNDDKGRFPLELGGNKGTHSQGARIGSETDGFDERAAEAALHAAPKIGEADGAVQLRQASQEFDVLSERHGNSSSMTYNANEQQIIAALQNKKAVRCQSPKFAELAEFLDRWHHAIAPPQSNSRDQIALSLR